MTTKINMWTTNLEEVAKSLELEVKKDGSTRWATLLLNENGREDKLHHANVEITYFQNH